MSNQQNSSRVDADKVFQVETRSKRLLLIEDNALNRQMLEEYLVFYGYQVFSLPGGLEFFQTLDSFQPHLILLDLKLPDIDGYTLLEQVRQKPNYQHIPIVVVSALAFRADRERALSLGVRRYLVKPLNLRDLQQTIKEELSKEIT